MKFCEGEKKERREEELIEVVDWPKRKERFRPYLLSSLAMTALAVLRSFIIPIDLLLLMQVQNFCMSQNLRDVNMSYHNYLQHR